MTQALADGGLKITSGGTDCHLAVVDLRPFGITGNIAEKALESVGITLNKNAIPNDTEKPMITSGIRVGSAAGTTRGFGANEYRDIAALCWTRFMRYARERSTRTGMRSICVCASSSHASPCLTERKGRSRSAAKARSGRKF